MSSAEPFRLTEQHRLALLMHGYLLQGYGKMGLGLLRYSQSPIVAVIERDHVGEDLEQLTGISRSVPIVGSVQEALDLGANTLVIGVATAGGVLPPDYWEEMRRALAGGMSLVNGLHNPLRSHPDLTPLLQAGSTIWDVRQEPVGLSNGTGLARELPAKRVLTVGTDMAVGKMTTSLEMDREARGRGLRSRFLASGQIGICIAGEGVALDAVRVDFASGAVEQMVLRHAQENDILHIEGQGSLLHPASTAWLPLIRGGCPTHLILVHRAGQEHIFRTDWVKIPPLREVIALYESICSCAGAMQGAKVVGISINCAKLNQIEAERAVRKVEAETGLPTTDVVRFGAGRLLDAVLSNE